MSTNPLYFNPSNIIPPSPPATPLSTGGITTAKIQKAALCVFAAGAAIVGGVLGCQKTRDPAFPIISFSLFASSLGLCYAAWNIKDYKNPQALEQMKIEALHLPFSTIVTAHGLKNIQQYEILSLSILQRKFEEEYGDTPFSHLLQKYPLETIKKYQLAPTEQLRVRFAKELQRLKVEQLNNFSLSTLHQYGILPDEQLQIFNQFSDRKERLHALFRNTQYNIDLKYPNRTEKLLARLKDKEAFVRQKAKDLKNTIQHAGYAATEVTTALRIPDPNKSVLGNAVDHFIARDQGQTISDLTAAAAAQQSLQNDLKEIEFEKQSIQKHCLGGQEQKEYDKEIQEAQQQLNAEIEKIQQDFHQSAASFLQSAILKIKKSISTQT